MTRSLPTTAIPLFSSATPPLTGAPGGPSSPLVGLPRRTRW